MEEVFIAGTQPTEFDQREQFDRQQQPVLVQRLRTSLDSRDFSLDGSSAAAPRPSLDLDLDTSRFDSRPGLRETSRVFDEDGDADANGDETTDEQDGSDTDTVSDEANGDTGANQDSDDGEGSGVNPLLD